MAVWLTMDMSYVGAGGSANTSRVAVSVDVHWDYKHFNRDGGSLTVTVDGVTDARTVPFNAGETSSGSQNIYSAYWDVAQPNGSAKTVYASATFQATSNTTATPASDSLYLSAISGSGGDSGDDGDDTGDDSGGSSGGSDDEGGSNIETHPDTNCIYLGTSQGGSVYGNNELNGVDSWYIKFKTPSDLISCTKVTLICNGFQISYNDGWDSAFVEITLYEGHWYNDVKMDSTTHRTFEGYTSWGKWTEWIYSSDSSYAQSFKPDTEYLIVARAGNGVFSLETPFAVILDYVALEKQCYISSESSNDPCKVYIEDGTTWYEYEAYIDTGTSWEPCN